MSTAFKKSDILIPKKNIDMKGSLVLSDEQVMQELVRQQKEKDMEDIENLWKGTVDNNQVERSYNGIFYAIGSVPNTDFIHLDSFSNLSRENMYDGYVPRMFSDRSIIIFSAGDVSYREGKRFQAIIAAAEGAETALEIM